MTNPSQLPAQRERPVLVKESALANGFQFAARLHRVEGACVAVGALAAIALLLVGAPSHARAVITQPPSSWRLVSSIAAFLVGLVPAAVARMREVALAGQIDPVCDAWAIAPIINTFGDLTYGPGRQPIYDVRSERLAALLLHVTDCSELDLTGAQWCTLYSLMRIAGPGERDLAGRSFVKTRLVDGLLRVFELCRDTAAIPALEACLKRGTPRDRLPVEELLEKLWPLADERSQSDTLVRPCKAPDDSLLHPAAPTPEDDGRDLGRPAGPPA